MAIRIGLIGFGTIGREVALAVRGGRAGAVELSAILVRDLARVAADDVAALSAATFTTSADDFFATKLDAIVEVGGHAALRMYGERVLRGGQTLITVSVGALADDEFLATLRHAAEVNETRLLVPSGAIAALDAVSSAAVGEIDEVTLLVRKPPAAWIGTPAEAEAMAVTDTPVCVYEGRVREAAGLFPQNVNVASALSLAGIGFELTRIRIIADPTIQHNMFELEARGEFGELKLELKNRPYPQNPKTGHLVVMSIIKTIKRLQERVIVGF